MVGALLALILAGVFGRKLFPPAGEAEPSDSSDHQTAPAVATAPATNDGPMSPPLSVPAPEPGLENLPLTTPEERAVAMAMLLMKPAGTEASARLVRDWIEANYRPLYAQINLSPGETTALGELLTARLEAIRTGLAAAATPGADGLMTAQQINAVSGVTIPPFEEQISQLLGPERYQAYQIYAGPMRSAIIGAVQQVRP